MQERLTILKIFKVSIKKFIVSGQEKYLCVC